MSFKVGDQVRLKSGGPLMTVSRVSKTLKQVKCQYYNENAKDFVEKDFHPDALKPVEE